MYFSLWLRGEGQIGEQSRSVILSRIYCPALYLKTYAGCNELPRHETTKQSSRRSEGVAQGDYSWQVSDLRTTTSIGVQLQDETICARSRREAEWTLADNTM
jgi:hypothetical protein